MKAVSLVKIKNELKHLSQQELIEVTLRLAKFKKENKELLTYLLFETSNEDGYIEVVKESMDAEFETMNMNTYYFIKKSTRKILRNTKKYIRYSKKPETEAELLLYFCQKMKEMRPSISYNTTLLNIYSRQLILIEKAIGKLHEDLQYDYKLALTDLED